MRHSVGLRFGEDLSTMEGGGPERALRTVPNPVRGAALSSSPSRAAGTSRRAGCAPGPPSSRSSATPQANQAAVGTAFRVGNPGFVLLLLGSAGEPGATNATRTGPRGRRAGRGVWCRVLCVGSQVQSAGRVPHVASQRRGGPVTPSANAELRGSHSVGRTSFPDGGAGRDGKRRFISASSSRLAEHLKEKKTVVFEKQQPYKDEQEKNPNPQIIINHLSGSVLKCFLPIAFEHLPIFIDLSIMYLPATVHTVRVATI